MMQCRLAFAFDHVNYSRYNSYQHVLLCDLKQKEGDAYSDLVDNGFGCTTTEKERFSAKHGDLETEHFNRETKGTACPFKSGYSTDINSVNRWIKTVHIHCKLRKIVKDKFRLLTSSAHKEMAPRNKIRHCDHVNNLKTKLCEYNAEPFKPGPARNMVTGKELDPVIIDGLIDAAAKGDEKYKCFVEERLIKGQKSLFTPIKKNNIKTGIVAKATKTKKVDVLTEERQAFGFMVAKCKTIHEAFSYPITSLPLSIANPDGTIYQSNKSGFRNDLIGSLVIDKYVYDAMWIIDAMYAIHMIKPMNTYRQFFEQLLMWMLPETLARPVSLVITTDDYRPNSAKEGTRKTRGEKGARVYVTGLEQKMPRGNKWTEFLNNGDNKNDLISLPIVFYERQMIWNILPSSTELLFRCNYEEADTKIPLHASMADCNVVVVATDTDVLILLVNVFSFLKPRFQWQMRYENNKYASINEISCRLGTEISILLPQFHALTGCDTTSYFFRVGKKKPFKKAVECEKFQLLSYLGSEQQLSEEGLSACKEFVRTVMYPGNVNETYIETRVRLYQNQAITSKSTLTIPPDEDSLTQAIKRAHYQAFVWNQCLSLEIPEINPLLNGWKVNDETLMPLWFVGPQFPVSVTKRRNDGYEADNEGKAAPKKKKTNRRPNRILRRRDKVLKTPMDEEEKSDGTVNDNSAGNWEHLSDFINSSDSSDSSDSDWM